MHKRSIGFDLYLQAAMQVMVKIGTNTPFLYFIFPSFLKYSKNAVQPVTTSR